MPTSSLRPRTAEATAADASDIASLPLSIDVGPHGVVSALIDGPAQPRAAYVFAHGAGAGMTHPFMAQLAATLTRHGLGVLRFQFPSRERGSSRPDTPAVAHATVRAAVAAGARHWPGVPLLAGGKSFGGRMTSQAQAESPLPGVVGLVFVGFPLHPAGRPATERARHLSGVACPMLFLQGTRDALADLARLRPVLDALGARATLAVVDDADHAFHVRASSGRRDVIGELAAAISAWAARITGAPAAS